MERLTMTSDKGGVAFTFNLDITCKPSEAQKILKLAQKLKEYEDAEEQGLLLRLPCKVGDTLWWTNAYGDLCSSEVNSMFIEHGIDGIVIETLICNINEKEIGKTVFLTKEEANSLLNDFLEGDEQNEQINRCR